MLRFRDHLRDPGYFRDIRKPVGDELREQHDLTDPLPQSLLALLKQLDIRVENDATRERLFAAVERCIAAMAQLERRNPRKTQEPRGQSGW
jgi:hypothetical protein